nr:immunoglobulin heavy chain junction region [Mus musculus]
CAREGFFDFW